MERNTILAIGLSFLVIIGFYIINPYFNPPPKPQTATKSTKDKAAQNEENKGKESKVEPKKLDQPSEKPETYTAKLNKIIPTEKYQLSDDKNKSKIKRIEIDTDIFEIDFTTVDAAVLNLKLKNYKDENGKLIDSVFFQGKKQVIPLATSFVGVQGIKNKIKAVYDYTVDTKNLQDFKSGKAKELKIRFYSEFYLDATKSKKIGLEKIYSLKNNTYLLSINIKVTNLSESGIIVSSNDSKSRDASFYIHWGQSLGPYYTDKSTYNKALTTAYLVKQPDGDVEETVLTDSNNEIAPPFQWLSLDSRYLVMSLVPAGEVKSYFGEIDQGKFTAASSFFGLFKSKIKENGEILGIGFRKFVLKGKESKNFKLSVFIGPKTRAVLNQYDEYDFAKIRNRSWLGPIATLMELMIEKSLFWMYELVKNFGWAIVLVTVVLKILLYPLTQKSTESTRKMQLLKPKIDAINAKYKKKPQEKQKAIMELYKKEGANPLGGCLPMLLQLPVFYALWAVVPSLLDLKNANFLGIHDLSSPDAVFHVPFWPFEVNILPLIMTVTSVVMTKLTPQSPPSGSDDASAQTAKMMQFMPVIFLFIFWNMPSGLVLYWTVQNILQIGQQLYTNHKLKLPVPAKSATK